MTNLATVLSYAQWVIENSNEVDIYLAESGADRERDFNRNTEYERLYDRYCKETAKSAIKIVNLTPHQIVVDNGVVRKVYPKSGTIARVDLDYMITGTLDGYPISMTRILKSNMPEAKEDTIYIVSALVLQQCKYAGRTDCVAPDSNHALRDTTGNIVSVPGWVM